MKTLPKKSLLMAGFTQVRSCDHTELVSSVLVFILFSLFFKSVFYQGILANGKQVEP